MKELGPDVVAFGADGLVPVVVQDAVTGDVLMLASMNEEALRLTRETGKAHYWSRGRGTLWRKGETSGHEQLVDNIRVNCELNSLLLQVRQIGAVCHHGYPTCYYRRIADDGSLTIVRDRAFDPGAVYPDAVNETPSETAREMDPLAEATRLMYGAYAYLRDRDLERESATSRRLRAPRGDVGDRIGDELLELAGVLTGEHRHRDREHDCCLEASQVIYWVAIATLRAGVTWARLRPDRALATAADDVPAATISQLLAADAKRWRASFASEDDIAAAAHATLALVGQACRCGGILPLKVIESDLDELRSRPYLADCFGRGAS